MKPMSRLVHPYLVGHAFRRMPKAAECFKTAAVLGVIIVDLMIPSCVHEASKRKIAYRATKTFSFLSDLRRITSYNLAL